MRAPDLEFPEPQGVDHLRCARDEGDDSHLPNIALALFDRGLFLEQFFEFVGLLKSLAERRDVQEADLKLNLGNGVHTHLYRVPRAPSIGA